MTMWQFRTIPVVALAAIATLCAACGSAGMVLVARYPTEPMSLEPDTGINVLVKTVTDARSFVEDPQMLKQPAVWDDEPLTKDSARIVGAKASEGKVPTNIYLEEGQSVTDIVQDLVSVALRQAGYRVVTEGEKTPDLVVEVSVDQFWLWMTPDAMTIRVESIIQASVSVTGDGVQQTFEVDGYHDSRDVSKSPESYVFAMNEGLFDFYTKMATTFIGTEIHPAGAGSASE